jgi:hypothetical protein
LGWEFFGAVIFIVLFGAQAGLFALPALWMLVLAIYFGWNLYPNVNVTRLRQLIDGIWP